MTAERFSSDLLPLVRPIDFAIEDPDNAKLHPDESVDAIASSLAAYGQYKPVVFWMRDGVPIVKAGNGTLRAAKKLGWERLAMTEFKGTERDAKTIALLDNKIPELAPWNPTVLAAQVAELGKDLPVWAPAEAKWEAAPVVAEFVPPVYVPPTIPPPAPATAVPQGGTRTRPGDMWVFEAQREGGGTNEHRLMCGDPKNRRVVSELCGTARPPLRRVVVAPDECASWWTQLGRTLPLARTAPWPGWAVLAKAFQGELARAGWVEDDVVRITHETDLSWLQGGVRVSEKAYELLQAAGADKGAFQHPYAALATLWSTMKAKEHEDTLYLEPAIQQVLEPNEVFLDCDGGSGSFLACMSNGRICYEIVVSPADCDIVLATVERFTGKKGTKA
jgi:hypothetical protein